MLGRRVYQVLTLAPVDDCWLSRWTLPVTRKPWAVRSYFYTPAAPRDFIYLQCACLHSVYIYIAVTGFRLCGLINASLFLFASTQKIGFLIHCYELARLTFVLAKPYLSLSKYRLDIYLQVFGCIAYRYFLCNILFCNLICWHNYSRNSAKTFIFFYLYK